MLLWMHWIVVQLLPDVSGLPNQCGVGRVRGNLHRELLRVVQREHLLRREQLPVVLWREPVLVRLVRKPGEPSADVLLWLLGSFMYGFDIDVLSRPGQRRIRIKFLWNHPGMLAAAWVRC